jgi:hypothetical protein
MNIGIALILGSSIMLILIFLSGFFFFMTYFCLAMIVLLIIGLIIFLGSLFQYSRPYSYCPICSRLLAWDNAQKIWFCHHCKKRWETLQEEMVEKLE